MSNHQEANAGLTATAASPREKKVAIGLGLASAIGLVVTAYLALAGDHVKLFDHDMTGWVLSLLAFLVGVSLVWLDGLYEGQWGKHHFVHLPREVGMAFLVSAVVFTLVELSLRIAESNRLLEEVALRQDLLKFLPLINPRNEEKTLHDYERGFEALANFKKTTLKMDDDQVNQWETMALDGYANLLMKKHDYHEALIQFKKALEIDTRRAEKNPHNYTLSTYVPVTQSAISMTQLHLGHYTDAHASVKKCVGHYQMLINSEKFTQEKMEELAGNLRVVKKRLTRFEHLLGVESLPPRVVTGDFRKGVTVDSDPDFDVQEVKVVKDEASKGGAETKETSFKRLRMVRDVKLSKGIRYKVVLSTEEDVFDPYMIVLCPKEGIYDAFDDSDNTLNARWDWRPAADRTYRIVGVPAPGSKLKMGNVKLRIEAVE